MRAIGLLYHDVVEPGQEDASGFPGAAPARYKLELDCFERQLDAIAAAGCTATLPVDELPAGGARPLFLTFDDGGASALRAAALVAERGWRGHFFITTDRIGAPTFVSESGLRELLAAGHVIGSHSCSHPDRMSRCSWDELVDEWARSVARLAAILGEPVTCASVPGGHYSANVARAAAAAGIATLFTSEPTTRVSTVDGCRVLGRYSILKGTPATTAAALAAGRLGPRTRQLAWWTAKKVAKRSGGGAYERLRRSLLARVS
jgi:hypothetical protein